MKLKIYHCIGTFHNTIEHLLTQWQNIYTLYTNTWPLAFLAWYTSNMDYSAMNKESLLYSTTKFSWNILKSGVKHNNQTPAYLVTLSSVLKFMEIYSNELKPKNHK